MPIYLDLANLLFDKKRLEEKYHGGCQQFRLDWKVEQSAKHQEDDELICLVAMNIDAFDIQKLMDAGLAFDTEQQHSDDFVAISRYGGAHWSTDWLHTNEVFAWHVKCKPKQKIRAIQIGEEMTMDEMQELADKGMNVLKTIKSEKPILNKEEGE